MGNLQVFLKISSRLESLRIDRAFTWAFLDALTVIVL